MQYMDELDTVKNEEVSVWIVCGIWCLRPNGSGLLPTNNEWEQRSFWGNNDRSLTNQNRVSS